MKTRGKGLIKFSSVMLLIAGFLTIGLMTAVLLNGGYETIIDDEINVLAALSALGAYVVGFVQIIGAVIGFIYCGKDDKANIITTIGMILIIITIAWLIPEVVTDNQAINWYVYGYSMLFPVLYYVGGKQNKLNS